MPIKAFGNRSFGAFLFDMDGTVLSSIAVTERVYGGWATRHGLDVAAFLSTIHGVRAVDNVRRLNLPGVDPETEAAVLLAGEMADVDGIEAIAGAHAFLTSLPADRWAIVTSAPRTLALRRLEAGGLPVPDVLVAAEDVVNGKPAPDCFIEGARRLGVPIEDCVVFEDAPAGIEAAEASGAAVVVITATHAHPVETRHPSIAGYEALRAAATLDGPLRFEAASTPGPLA